MAKDIRYLAIPSMVSQGVVITLSQVFEIIPRTIVARDLGINYLRLKERVRKPENFSVGEIFSFSKLLELSPSQVFSLIEAEIKTRIKE